MDKIRVSEKEWIINNGWGRRRSKRDGKRLRRIESKEYEISIPLDLIPDILLRLPAKSIARFRCVSKLWSSITTRPSFTSLFTIHQSSTRLRLLVSFKTRGKCYFISLPQHEHPVTSYSQVDRFQINSPVFYGHSPRCYQSVQGLMCFKDFDRTAVYNPTMRQHLNLPEPQQRLTHTCICLGYDPVEDKYKVLCILARIHQPVVFTLGPQESWRVIRNSPKHLSIGRATSACINGHVYYQAWLDINIGLDGEYKKSLMSFDVRYEKLKTINKPNDQELGDIILNYEGKLAWVCSTFFSSKTLRFWVLEDEEKQEWSLKTFLLPFSVMPEIDPIWEVMLKFKSVTHDTSEFIYFATSFEAIYVLYYDPKRNHTRRVIYEGFGDREFMKRCGIVNLSSDNIHCYPNHIESLMSLENVPRLV